MVKHLHIRLVDDTGKIMGHGGITLAYSCTKKDIFVQVATCRMPGLTMAGNWCDGDMFSRKLGREIATSRLRSEGPLEILPLDENEKPSQTLVKWVERAMNLVPVRNHENRWVVKYASSG